MGSLDQRSWYAHTPPTDGGEWHLLSVHLEAVAERARTHAEPFGAGDLAYLLGLFHDLGKFQRQFQEYLECRFQGKPHRIVPHAIWGAALAFQAFPKGGAWKELALPILGHHAGLGNGGTVAQDLAVFLEKNPDAVPYMAEHLQKLPCSSRAHVPSLPPHHRELFIRMLFSALVDADYLDTERHFHLERAEARSEGPTMGTLLDRLKAEQLGLMAQPSGDPKVAKIRREVYERCLQAAAGPQGIYRLTVPTGGGKTRSGLAFALAHAQAHDLRRVVVGIPYTSIIDQTAKVYREILGNEVVLEHHSQVAVADDEAQDPQRLALHLASENWDVRVVVTTTVQLLESLFTNRPGQARKLHNLARSVIILDEVQALPPELLDPTLDVLRALVEQYGVTLVLSTATQPTFEDSHYLKPFQGVEIREIVEDYPQHFQALRRVRYRLGSTPMDWEAIAEEVRSVPQVMVILNSRKNALALLDALDETDDVYHLSALLCGAHRRRILAEITQRLAPEARRPVRLVSTQVVEAGVDLDFPIVWRAVGPLDRIVQAAGRCNREARLAEGEVVIFKPMKGSVPSGPYTYGMAVAGMLLEKYGAEKLHDPDLYRQYFRRLYSAVDPDKKQIQSFRNVLNFPEVAQRYRLIDRDTVPVVVDYGDSLTLLERWLDRPNQMTWRLLQPYLVNMLRSEARTFEEAGWLVQVSDGLYRWLGQYDERKGIQAMYDPSDMITQ